MSTVLVINPGSTSKKYALVRDGEIVLEACYEKTETGFQSVRVAPQETPVMQTESEDAYRHALTMFARVIKERLGTGETLAAIGIRVVATGSHFQNHQAVTDVLISQLREQEENAPLHIPLALQEIQQCRLVFDEVPLYAVSDTAFFAKLPAVAREVSLPRDLVRKHDIHRFGYHGLSVSSVINRVHSVIGTDPERLIVCHLGGGCSVSGVLRGHSVYTSSGFSSLSGLPMMTRAGDTDVGAVFHISRCTGLDYEAIHTMLQTEAGLKGLTGTDDLRRVLDKKSQGDPEAAFAADLIANQLQEKIAAASVATGGIDALVLTGTIGWRSPTFRLLATNRLAHFGIGIDEDKNDIFLGREGVISLRRSLVKVVVMRTDEMREIARIALHQSQRGVHANATI